MKYNVFRFISSFLLFTFTSTQFTFAHPAEPFRIQPFPSSGIVAGSLSELSKDQINNGITRSGIIKANVLNTVLLQDVASLGLELGLNSTFTNIIGLGLFLVRESIRNL